MTKGAEGAVEQSLESELESIRDTVEAYARRMLSLVGDNAAEAEKNEIVMLGLMARLAKEGLAETSDAERQRALDAVEFISAEWAARGYSEIYCKVVALENFGVIEGPSGAVN